MTAIEVVEPGHWAIVYRARPTSMNTYRTLHWRKAREHDAEWRKAGFALAKQAKIEKLEVVRFVVIPFGPGHHQDPANCFPSVKAMIDGVVDAAVIADDDGDHVAGIELLPWRHEKAPGLLLHIHEVTDGS